MSASAALIGDEGAAAADAGEFFRSPDFLAAEGVTHTLAIEGASEPIRLPVIVREIPGGAGVDAISPYGYPGASAAPADPPDPQAVDWSATGLVSVFVRDRVGASTCLRGGTRRADVHIADPSAPTGVRKRLREQIRRNERHGWSVRPAPGPDAAAEDRAAFERAYTQTMERTGASARYFFEPAYFERVLASDASWLLLAGRGEEPPSAGAIAVRSDGYLHYFLGGTADEALSDSPMKNLFAAMIELSAQAGLPLHLGGGVEPGDSLDRFKAGFANASEPFFTHEVVCDRDAYARLSGEGATAGFFPAYRAG